MLKVGPTPYLAASCRTCYLSKTNTGNGKCYKGCCWIYSCDVGLSCCHVHSSVNNFICLKPLNKHMCCLKYNSLKVNILSFSLFIIRSLSTVMPFTLHWDSLYSFSSYLVDDRQLWYGKLLLLRYIISHIWYLERLQFHVLVDFRLMSRKILVCTSCHSVLIRFPAKICIFSYHLLLQY